MKIALFFIKKKKHNLVTKSRHFVYFFSLFKFFSLETRFLVSEAPKSKFENRNKQKMNSVHSFKHLDWQRTLETAHLAEIVKFA